MANCKIIIQEIALQLVLEMAVHIQFLQNDQSPIVCSYDRVASPTQAKLNKRRPARADKHIIDLFILAGSPRDALFRIFYGTQQPNSDEKLQTFLENCQNPFN